MSEENVKRVLSKKSLLKAAFNWETWVQTCYNYERMMGQSVGMAFVPVIHELFADEPDAAEKRKEVMKRETEFFNVHTEFGSCIVGMAIALEEQKSLGENIPSEFITSLKTSMMGPLAGIGDTIYQGVLIPILIAICIDINLTGTYWGSIIYFVLMLALSYGFSFANFFFGYRKGSEAIMEFLEKGLLDKLLAGAEIMGCMVMGGLIANYVNVQCGLVINTSDSVFNIQEALFDAVLPKILPLGFTMLVYYLIKKRWSAIKIIGLIIVIGVIGGLTGILA